MEVSEGLAWVRSRYYTYYQAGKWRSDPTSDLGRINRQQDFIHQLMAQAVEKATSRPSSQFSAESDQMRAQVELALGIRGGNYRGTIDFRTRPNHAFLCPAIL